MRAPHGQSPIHKIYLSVVAEPRLRGATVERRSVVADTRVSRATVQKQVLGLVEASTHCEGDGRTNAKDARNDDCCE